MERFLKSKIFLFNKATFICQFAFSGIACAISFTPQGKLVRKFEAVSQVPTVQMYFDPNRPPVINITPGRPTIVQFPVEVRACVSASNLVTVSYADKYAHNADKGASEGWYSAVVLNVGSGIQGARIQEDDILKIPPTAITCQIRNANVNAQEQQDTYSWQTVGISVADEKNTYFVVYLLNTPQSKNLPTENEMARLGAKPATDFMLEDRKAEKSNPKLKIDDHFYGKGVITRNKLDNKSNNESEFFDLFTWEEK